MPSGLLYTFVVVVISLSPSVGHTDDPPRIPKVLILGIDGCRPDALKAADAPHLHALIKQGAFSDKAQTGEYTVSGPGWASMFTGVWHTKHGVRDNRFDAANFKAYPHFFRRLKQVRPAAYTILLVQWWPIATQIVTDPDLSRTFLADARVADEAVKVLRERDPDVLFLHFDEVDKAGHKYGFHPSVTEYTQAIARADADFGRVLAALRERPAYGNEDWLILVTTDHGGSDKGHGRNIPEHRTIFIIVSGSAATKGAIDPAPAIVDVAATALVHLRIPLDDKWQLDGKPIGLKKRRTSGN
jgi:predicted AlkP superfamily pyrophosphatase or phosphodiesterase